MRVTAYEGDGPAAAALRRAMTGSRVDAIHRDLVRQPLSPKELAPATVVVLDPPFAGAGPQMPAIAASGASRVIYVSCNPTALTRDAAILARAGYALLAATAIDQFLWSTHVECVAVFQRSDRSRAQRDNAALKNQNDLRMVAEISGATRASM